MTKLRYPDDPGLSERQVHAVNDAAQTLWLAAISAAKRDYQATRDLLGEMTAALQALPVRAKRPTPTPEEDSDELRHDDPYSM